MRYQLLGNTGLRVSELCLGTMTFGNTVWGSDELESRLIYEHFRAVGGNFIDTANEIYSEGRSEKMLGTFFADHRDEIVLATKYTLALPGSGNPNRAGNHRKSMRRSVESSLRRLATDYIDLLWVHAWDELTPIEEMLRGLEDLVRAGKVLYIGISNAPAWVVSKANTLAQSLNLSSFAAIQVEYNLLERTIEHELFPMAKHFGMSVAAWSPLASGVLTGKYAKEGGDRRLEAKGVQAHRALDENVAKVTAEIGEMAQQLGCTSAQVALSWLRAQPGVIPLLGARSLEQLEDNLGCLDVDLDTATRNRLTALTAPTPHHPQDFLARNREIINGGFASSIDH